MLLRVDLFHVKPDRRNDLIELVRETAPHFERLGARSVNLMSAFVPDQGIIYAMAEYENMSALASSREAASNDEQMQKVLQRWFSEDSPASGVTRLLLREIQRFGTPPDDFDAVIVRQANVKPGRLDDILAITEQVGLLLATYGAGAIVSVPVLGGAADGPNLYYGARFPDLGTLAKWIDDVPGNETMQQVVAAMTGPDAPVTPVANGIATRVPL